MIRGTFICKEVGTKLEIRYNLHPHRKNNVKVAGMYAAYQQGKSLAEVAKMYRITRQAVYDMFRSRGYELRSKPMRVMAELDGIKFYEMKGGYLRGTTSKGRVTIQRYVWEKHNGPVPDDHVIHFVDGNKLNFKPENLALVKKSNMARKFNPNGNNQHTKK